MHVNISKLQGIPGSRNSMADIRDEKRSRLFHLNDVPPPADYVMQQGSSEEESPESAATDPGTVLPRCVIQIRRCANPTRSSFFVIPSLPISYISNQTSVGWSSKRNNIIIITVVGVSLVALVIASSLDVYPPSCTGVDLSRSFVSVRKLANVL